MNPEDTKSTGAGAPAPMGRRKFLTHAGAGFGLVAAGAFLQGSTGAREPGGSAPPGPDPGTNTSDGSSKEGTMNIHWQDTAIVFIDPQNDVLSEHGIAWPLLHESLKENNTVENMERIFKAAKSHGFEVFISPHYFFPSDKGWKFNGPLETDEATSSMFARKDRLSLDGFEGSGADWLERFKPYIEDGRTIVASPHRVWGPQTNDLVLQLRKRRIGNIILGGMLANMCVESHLRELLEQGFEVAVVKDATAAPKHPEWGYGYTAALINYAYLAHAVMTTDQVVKVMERTGRNT
jgi:nicotinamidase-related amidase